LSSQFTVSAVTECFFKRLILFLDKMEHIEIFFLQLAAGIDSLVQEPDIFIIIPDSIPRSNPQLQQFHILLNAADHCHTGFYGIEKVSFCKKTFSVLIDLEIFKSDLFIGLHQLSPDLLFHNQIRIEKVVKKRRKILIIPGNFTEHLIEEPAFSTQKIINTVAIISLKILSAQRIIVSHFHTAA